MSNNVNVVIAIGGTGARCAEAVAHLAAAGVYQGPVRLLLVDLDQANGNLDRTQRVVSQYQALGSVSAGGSLFADEISLDVWKPSRSLMLNGNGSLPFGAFLGRDSVSGEVGHFLDLFFSQSLYGFDMTGGCFQHPEIGAIVLRSALRQSLDDEDGALRRCVEQIANDLKSGYEVRVLVAGSVFGGTGASGLPFFPSFFRRELPERFEALRTRSDHLHLGGVLMAPYFQWTGQPENGNAGEGPDSNRLSPHAKAVLQHYAKHPPGYEAIYVLGAPHLHPSGTYADRGNRQVNKAHYVEFVTALAAWDFFRRPIDSRTDFLYAESTTGDEQRIRRQLGVNWRSLPDGGAAQTSLLRWTLAAAFLESYLLPGIRNGAFVNYPWFRDTVGEKLDTAEDKLLSSAVQSYRRWLGQVLESISTPAAGRDHPSLLPLKQDQLGALEDQGVTSGAETLPGFLLHGQSQPMEFNDLCARMDKVPPRRIRDKDGGKSSLGRLVLAVDRAVSGLLESERARKAVKEWIFGDPTTEKEQSRYLPRVEWEPDVHPQPGSFSSGGSDLLLKIANGLVVGKADLGNSNPISSPWARAYLFENALSNGGDTTRDAAVKAWRGLLGILAFRQHLGGGSAVNAVRLDLESESGRYGLALAEFVQEAKAYKQRQWLTFYTLTLGGEPIGGTSPLTLLFPSQQLSRSSAIQALVPWFNPETRALEDPAEYFQRHTGLADWNRRLKAWLNHLLGSGVLEEKIQGGFAAGIVRQEIQRWAQNGALAQVVPDQNVVFDVQDQFLGGFTLPAIPLHQRGGAQ